LVLKEGSRHLFRNSSSPSAWVPTNTKSPIRSWVVLQFDWTLRLRPGQSVDSVTITLVKNPLIRLADSYFLLAPRRILNIGRGEVFYSNVNFNSGHRTGNKASIEKQPMCYPVTQRAPVPPTPVGCWSIRVSKGRQCFSTTLFRDCAAKCAQKTVGFTDQPCIALREGF